MPMARLQWGRSPFYKVLMDVTYGEKNIATPVVR